MMTQRKNSKQINFIPPTYNNNNTTKRSISYNSLNTNDENAAAASTSNSSSALIANNININYNHVSPRILVDANGNQQSVIYPTVNQLPPRIPVPPIFLPPENKFNNNNINNHHHHHNDQSTFDKFKLKVQKIFNRSNSKSPNSSKYNIDESADNVSNFKSYVNLNRPRNDNGHASNSLGKTNGAALFKHSTSLQDQLKNEQYASNYDLNNTTTTTTTTTNNTTTNINRNVIFVNNLPNKRGEKFFYDIETKAEIKKKLGELPVEDRIRIQENGYMLLKKQVELNAVRLDSKKIDIQELKDELKQLNEPFRSGFEIEQLKGDIRSLTNEKAELEYKISKSKPWPCKKCTYRNSNESIKCKICNAERYEILEDDFIICTNCNLKNPLINFNCSSCNLYFYANSSNAADLNNSQTFVVNNRKSTNSSLASSSSSTSLSSPILPTLLAQYSTSSTHSNGLTSTAGNDSPRFANNNSVF